MIISTVFNKFFDVVGLDGISVKGFRFMVIKIINYNLVTEIMFGSDRNGVEKKFWILFDVSWLKVMRLTIVSEYSDSVSVETNIVDVKNEFYIVDGEIVMVVV